MESFAGTTIGGLKLTQLLGTGCTGQTFAATDAGGQPAAVKIIHSNLSLFTRAQAYWSELEKVGALSHPHICAPTSADWSKSGRFFLRLPLLAGMDLHEALLRHTKLPLGQVLRLAGQVCLALEAAHQQGMVHGALKPHNIFLVPSGSQSGESSTRVLDFATSCLLTGSDGSSLAPGSPGAVEATYLAPEQFGGQASKASDVYALGVIMFEAATGRRPFAGTWSELAEAHARQTPALPAGFPSGLGAVLLKALAKSPAERFAGTKELREAVEDWARSSPPELAQPDVPLFTKEAEGSGVAQEEAGGERTVRVPLDELSIAVREAPAPHMSVAEVEQAEQVRAEPPGSAPHETDKKRQPMPDVKTSTKSVPEDKELAAIAEKAASPLRAKLEKAGENDSKPGEPGEATQSARRTTEQAAQPAAKDKPVESFVDEDDDLVELPLERSVRAYLSNLIPGAPPPLSAPRPSGNGESLESALDAFVVEARSMRAALPPPVMDDKKLAELAKAPLPAPAPARAAAPAPAHAAAPAETKREARVTSPGPVAAPPPRRSVLVPCVLSFVIGGGAVYGGYRLLMTPSEPTATTGTPSTPSPSTAGSSSTAAEPKPAAVPSATPLADAGPSVATTALEAGAPASREAGSAAAAPSSAGATTPDAAPSAGAAATPAAAEPQPGAKKAKKAATKRPADAVIKRPTKKAKEPKEPKKGGGSDWVDPFSQ